MKKTIAFTLSIVMLISFFVFFGYAESPEKEYEILDGETVTFDGNYNKAENKIEIHGNINYDVLVSHRDCKIEVYKLLPNQSIDDIAFGSDETLVASMDIAVKFSFSFAIKSSADRFYKYVVVLCTPNGKRIEVSQPKYLTVVSEYNYADNGNKYFKGISDDKNNTSVYSDIGAGTAIIPVYYYRLLNNMSNGYLFPHEDDYCYFYREYIDELNATVRSYSASGARVYLQLLLLSKDSSKGGSKGEETKYFMPDIYSSETVSLICTYVSYLTTNFDKYTEGKISGFIVGENIDIKNCNYTEETDLNEYARKYAYYLTVVSNTAIDLNPILDIVVPISANNSFSEGGQLSQGNFSSAELIEAVSKELSETCSKPVKFSLLVDTYKTALGESMHESGNSIFAPIQNEGAELIGVDNIDLVIKFTEALTNTKKYVSAPNNIILKWSIPDTVGGNLLSATYPYMYYSLIMKNKVSAFVVSFDNAQVQSFDAIEKLMRNIDTSEGLTESRKLLPMLGIKSWDKIIKGFSEYNENNLVVKKRYSSENFNPNEKAFTGSFSYISFVHESIKNFYDGSFSKGIKSAYGIDGRRVLNQRVAQTDRDLHTDLFCLFEYEENYAYTPALKINVGISDSAEIIGALYEVKAVIGNGSESVERTCIVKSGTIHEVWLDMSGFNKSNKAEYIRISTRSITGTSSEYSLLVYDVCGYSAVNSSEELQTLISEERARIREQYDTEVEEGKNTSLYKIVFIILIIAILAIGILFVFLRRDDDENFKPD